MGLHSARPGRHSLALRGLHLRGLTLRGLHLRGLTLRSLALRRVRALLAGGLVLGLGATVTLAAWTDDELATTQVGASTFGIVGSTNGTTFAEHPSAGTAAALSFTPAVQAMSPGAVSFASFAVRTTAASTVGGTLAMSTQTAPTGAIASQLQYAVRAVPTGSSCTEALFTGTVPAANVIVPNGTTFTTAVGANSQPLTAAGGSTVTYCVRISMLSTAPTTVQGQTATVTWRFTGTST